jgi:hypothetical protein
MVPYLVAIWVAFLALSGITPYCDLYAAETPHGHAGESAPGDGPANSNAGISTSHHRGDTATPHDHDSPHSHCCQLSNAEYDMAKAGALTDALRIPSPVFLLATVDAGLVPRQVVEVQLARPSVDPPPPKQHLYILIQRYLI